MKITAGSVHRLTIPLVKPFSTALRTVDTLESVIITVETDTGFRGFGEAAPSPHVTGDTIGSICHVLKEFLVPALIGRDLRMWRENHRVISSRVKGHTSAKAAVDMALWDLAARAYDVSVCRLLGGEHRDLVSDFTISAGKPEDMAHDAREAVSRGYRQLKVKVGKDTDLDLDCVLAVSEAAGREVSLRLDANQGWNAKQAVSSLRILLDAGVNIELLEQPVPADDTQGLAFVRDHLEIPVAADEALFSSRDAASLLQGGAADVLNIKLMKSGGISEAQHICSVAESYGALCMIGCMLESRTAVTAAAHLASAARIITRIDLDSPLLCAEDPVMGGAQLSGPVIMLSESSGYGIEDITGLKDCV